MNVVLKSAGDPRALIPTVRDVLKEIDPQKPAHGLYALEDLIGATYARDRQAMMTLLGFAGTTVFLAVLSVYGVLSQRVRERSREIGIRMAMGAVAFAVPPCDSGGIPPVQNGTARPEPYGYRTGGAFSLPADSQRHNRDKKPGRHAYYS